MTIEYSLTERNLLRAPFSRINQVTVVLYCIAWLHWQCYSILLEPRIPRNSPQTVDNRKENRSSDFPATEGWKVHAVPRASFKLLNGVASGTVIVKQLDFSREFSYNCYQPKSEILG